MATVHGTFLSERILECSDDEGEGSGQEDRQAAIEKSEAVVAKLKAMKLPAAARTIKEGILETLTYTSFPREHWRKIRTNNPMERIMREIRRRTRVVGNFPDGNSALMLVTARLRSIAGKTHYHGVSTANLLK